MAKNDLETRVTEVAAYMFGNTWALAAMLCAMIQSGAIRRDEAVAFLSQFSRTMREAGVGPCATLPLEHVTMLIEMAASEGAEGGSIELEPIRAFMRECVVDSMSRTTSKPGSRGPGVGRSRRRVN